MKKLPLIIYRLYKSHAVSAHLRTLTEILILIKIFTESWLSWWMVFTPSMVWVLIILAWYIVVKVKTK